MKSIHDGSHLTLEERQIIEMGIKNRCPKSRIADTIGKDPTTVAKEIREHREFRPRNTFNHPCICIHIKECRSCRKKCDAYEEPSCKGRDRSPGACNGCKTSSRCHLDKYFYYAQQAHAAYRETLICTREGIDLTEQERLRLGAFLAPLFHQGQSIYQMLSAHPTEIPLSSRCLYYYVEMGVFKDFGIDKFSLKETVNRRQFKSVYKPRKQPAVYDGHKFEDYKAYCAQYPDVPTTEMDTLYNHVSGPFLQTFYFANTDVMIARLHQQKNSVSMASAIDDFQQLLTPDEFAALFSLILTDRGSEFEKIRLFESNQNDGTGRLRLFFCDPMQSAQKPHVENTHNYVRDIIPNGMSLQNLTQADLDLAFSHINSTPRKKLNGKTPYELFAFHYGEDLLAKLNIVQIERDKVILKPYLLKHRL